MVIYLRFGIHLGVYGAQKFDTLKGPHFHRWLPNGKGDELIIPTADSRNRISVWFERRGYIEHKFIVYDRDRTEVYEDTMIRQGKLEAGPLRGEAEFGHITKSELKAVSEGRIGSDEYISVAKRIIDFLYPPLSALIDLLRIQYGQYWLRELEPWDSRSHSLGAYCSLINLKWRASEDDDWQKFQPTDLSSTFRLQGLPGRGFAEYLTQDDWRYLQSSFSLASELPLAARIIGRAHQLSDSGHINESFVQAVTGLELSIEHFLKTHGIGLSDDAMDSLRKLTTLPMKSKLSILMVSIPSISQSTLELALKAIDLRNDIVHEGKKGTDKGRKMFLALLQCAKALLGMAELKTPSLGGGNVLYKKEEGRTTTN